MRICIQCNERFSGRSDKKFCSDYCRNQYNYSKSRYAEKDILDLHCRIRKNHRIICNIYKSGCGKIDINILKGLGYNLEIVTGINLENSIFSIYDISFKFEENYLVFLHETVVKK
ncbi:MAG: hypothetical protein JXR58_06630 [Bacteroidales bacterium]|nr:hypothetical protein [Bacteroidales bacterium]